MYVRGAKKHEEAWLLDRIDDLGLADPAFRSRDYAVAVDEESGSIVGFGRLRVHSGDPEVCEVTTLGVLPDHRERGAGAHVLERLAERARDRGFDAVYSLTDAGGYLTQFGFERVAESDLPEKLRARLEEVRDERPDAEPFLLAVGEFEVPRRLRERFRRAGDDVAESGVEEAAEDFGIDTDSATYKYDTGR
jgi:N-acetylglutamate synthase-like GNAT family acetyltransferase